MPRRFSRDFSSSSESGDSEVNPFDEQPEKDFTIPSPVSLRLSVTKKRKSQPVLSRESAEDAGETFEEEEDVPGD